MCLQRTAISEVPYHGSTLSSCHGVQSMIIQSIWLVSMFCRLASLMRCLLPCGIAPFTSYVHDTRRVLGAFQHALSSIYVIRKPMFPLAGQSAALYACLDLITNYRIAMQRDGIRQCIIIAMALATYDVAMVSLGGTRWGSRSVWELHVVPQMVRKRLHTSSRWLCTVRMAWWRPLPATIAAIGKIEAVKWGVGLLTGVTIVLAAIAEVRHLPFYTYDLAFEALLDTLQKCQHIVTKLTMYWVKFSGDPEEDAYRYTQSRYWDKLVVTLWSAV